MFSQLRRVISTVALKNNIRNNCKRNISALTQLQQFNKDDDDGREYKNVKYLLYFAYGCILYKLYKEKSLLSTAYAAVPFSGSNLTGRRKQYNFIADVVETSAPAVVYIEIKDTRAVDFFTGKPQTISNGSGFIIKEDGLILTNAHVVTNKPNAKVQVRLYDGTVYDGMVEDIDVQSDLATVRVNAKKLPVMKLGNSSDIKPGEFVVALGSPLSLSNTVTLGVVSSTQRGSDELGLRGKDMVYIQTDAAITFGNSGGPLVNLDGEAIAVNSMKVAAGISFAIPIDYVKEFLKNTSGQTKVPKDGAKRRYIGITMITLTKELINEMQERHQNVPPHVNSGVLVWKIMYGSPAHMGGLQPGDIVISINGTPTTKASDIYNILSEKNTRKLKMEVVRRGAILEINVTPEDVN